MSEPIIERVGFKKAMYITAAIQIVGVVRKYQISTLPLHLPAT